MPLCLCNDIDLLPLGGGCRSKAVNICRTMPCLCCLWAHSHYSPCVVTCGFHVQCHVVWRPKINTLIVAFRGTASKADALVDLKTLHRSASFLSSIVKGAKVHRGKPRAQCQSDLCGRFQINCLGVWESGGLGV
jgi:hypothetical protein